MYKKILIWACLISSILLTYIPAYAARSLSFDSSYAVWPYSNRAFSGFGVELYEAHGFLFDWVQKEYFNDNAWGRGGLFAIDVALSELITSTYLTTYHEFGHYSRDTALGRDVSFVGRPNHFFGFFLDKLVRGPFRGEMTLSIGSALTHDEQIVAAAGGVNNEMRFSGEIADRTYYDQGHVMDFIPYLKGKLSAIRYMKSDDLSNDMNVVVNGYNTKEYNITRSKIDRANWLALFLSTSTYVYALGIYDFFEEGETAIKTFEFEGWRLPDVEAYLNRKGISYKLKSAYRWDETLIFPFSYEVILHGASQHEVTLGIQKLWSSFYNISTRGNIVLGDGIGGSFSIRCPLLKDWAITLGIEHYDSKNLHGERNSVATNKQRSSTEAWVKLSFLY